MWNFRVIIVYKRRFKCIHSRKKWQRLKMKTLPNQIVHTIDMATENCDHNSALISVNLSSVSLELVYNYSHTWIFQWIWPLFFLCFCLSIIILLTNNNQMIRFISYSIFNLYNTRCLLYVERLLSQIHQFMVAARMISKLEKGNLNDLKKLVFIFNRLALNIFE